MLESAKDSLLLLMVFASYLLIMGLVLLSRATYYRTLMATMKDTGYTCYVGASIGLLIGLFLVLSHNFWAFDVRVLVTVLCWLVLIKSILWLIIPERMLALVKKVATGRSYYVCIVFMLCVGINFILRGFYIYTSKLAILQ